jgi:CheY-like chemotaxis protein
MSFDILVSESDPNISHEAEEILQSENLNVVTTADTVAALEKHKPDLILLDWQMPSIDGLEVLKRIQKTAPTLPIILMTTTSSTKEFQDAMEHGAVDFLRVPLDPYELRFRVLRTLRTVKPQRELHDPKTGRLDANRIAKHLGISLLRLAKAIGMNYKAVHRSPSSKGIQKHLEPIAASIVILSRYFNERDEMLAWFNTPHPELDNQKAISVIENGQAVVVRNMLEGTSVGIPT